MGVKQWANLGGKEKGTGYTDHVIGACQLMGLCPSSGWIRAFKEPWVPAVEVPGRVHGKPACRLFS